MALTMFRLFAAALVLRHVVGNLADQTGDFSGKTVGPLDKIVSGSALSEAGCVLVAFAATALALRAVKMRGRKRLAKRESALKTKIDSSSTTSAATSTRSISGPKCTIASQRARYCVNSDGDFLAACVRAGRANELPRLLQHARLRAIANGVDAAIVRELASRNLLSSLRACVASRCLQSALDAYDHECRHIGGGSGNLWSVLLYIAVETRNFDRCEKFFQNLCCNENPSGNDFVNIVRFHAQGDDFEGMRTRIGQLRSNGFTLDVVSRNRALQVCTTSKTFELAEIIANEEISGVLLDTVAYNTLIKGYAQSKNTDRCSDLYSRMCASGVQPSEMTYGIMLDASIQSRELDRAKQIFKDLRCSGLQMNVVHYTVFMKGLASAGYLDDATAVLSEMSKSPQTKPDLVAYCTLVKAQAEHGNVTEAICVLQQMIRQGMKLDSIIFNIVLSGCSVRQMEVSQISEAFDWLLEHGLKVSTSTLSILIKSYAKTCAWEEAFDLLASARTRLGIVPEVRLYTQLAQACAGVNDGKRVMQAYIATLRLVSGNCASLDHSTSARLCRLATACGQSEAGRVHDAVKQAGGFLTPEALASLLADVKIP
eukprot:TRINITY_DN383_c0_g1_i7.p1 TRINITY_DN383_c0_g1~~TRINITY_DN383_c0_g1_i7.p1  ORF type:complete len:599 (+),score=74.16 TRINITY_DN383_c0_g1_i7:173-1969(+)